MLIRYKTYIFILTFANVGVKLVHSTSFTDSHNKNSSESIIAKIILIILENR